MTRRLPCGLSLACERVEDEVGRGVSFEDAFDRAARSAEEVNRLRLYREFLRGSRFEAISSYVVNDD